MSTDPYLPDLAPDEIAAVCASRGHPGCTFNPWYGTTWCRCGEVTYPGDAVNFDLTRNLGPLSSWRPRALLSEEA